MTKMTKSQIMLESAKTHGFSIVSKTTNKEAFRETHKTLEKKLIELLENRSNAELSSLIDLLSRETNEEFSQLLKSFSNFEKNGLPPEQYGSDVG